MSKTICFFNTNRAWGGGEKWHLEMALQLKKRDFDPVLFVYPGAPLHHRALRSDLKCFPVRVNNLSWLNVYKIARLARVFKMMRPGAVILNLSSDLKFAGRAAKKAGLKKIIYRRGSAIPVKNSASNRFLFKKVIRYVITNSYATRETLLQNNSDLIGKDKIHVIYNGVKLPEDEPLLANAYPKNGREWNFGNAGRLSEQKGYNYLLEVADRLVQKNIPFKMHIAGTGELESTLRQQCTAMKLDEHVVWHGFVKDIPAFMQKLDLLVFPSIWEGFGYTLVDAMLAKVPVVAFDISSNPEVIEHGTTGMLVNPFDLDAMVSEIVRLTKNPGLLKQLGDNGYHRVKEKFGMEKAVDGLCEVLGF